MKKKGLKGLFRGALLLIFTLISVTAFSGNSAKASTYKDGTYTISVNAYQTGTQEASRAQQFFGTSATAVVHNDNADVTMTVSDNGSKLLGGSAVGGQPALSSDKHTLNFTVPVGTKSSVATFDVPIMNMHQQCDFVFDWSSVPADDASNSSSDSSSSSSIDSSSSNLSSSLSSGSSSASSSDSSPILSSSSISNSSSSDSTSSVPANQQSGQGSKDPQGTTGLQVSQGQVGDKGAKGDAGTSADVSTLGYTVLQADDKSTSAANQYYTHVADVAKQPDGSYKITMHVQYSKKSGMTAKGFVPLTVNGQNVSDVTYGSTADDYTASFSFTTPTLDDLTKAPVKGTIHVTVGLVNISSNFDVYYKFSANSQSNGGTNSGANNQNTTPGTTGNTGSNGGQAAPGNTNGGTQSSASAGAPTSTTPAAKTSSTAQQSSSKLPQTSEIQNIAAAVAGMISLILVVATAIIRRKQA